MHLSIRARPVGDVTILELEGRVTLGAEADALYQQVRALLDQQHPRIVLQMEKVHRVDSAGWGAVMRSVGSARRAGGDVRLLKPSKPTRELLELLGLWARPDVLRVFVDEQEVVESFAQQP
ncbi:MAG TPA: STAS domain-containing protein [Candidatus Xenobia bacterium]|nr:STAS domain-containing protein [Candidatus Xenobia bacterium]